MDEWANHGIDLHLDLDATGGVRDRLEQALRQAVRTGRLAPGARLPSSRVLAQDLGIARNTVADAYSQLVAEGWLTARQGAGTRVSSQAFEFGATATAATPRALPPLGNGEEPPAFSYDMRPGTSDLSTFPREAWLTASRKALTNAPHDALGYGDPRGRLELREALAEYLARVRGVRATPDTVVVCSGFAQAIGILGRTLFEMGGRRVAVEALGLPSASAILRNVGMDTIGLPVDAAGVRVEDLGNESALVFTPSHQFPTGVALPPGRRAAAIRWARESGAVLIEDDYDGEFRYDRQPIGAVQGLAPNQVVYAGTTSKSLAPGLRLGWLVLPAHLIDSVVAQKQLADRHTSVIDQLTLAEFITSGAYDRHVRRMRTRYRHRRDLLVADVARHAPHVEITGIAAGLHAVLELPHSGPSEAAVIERARRLGLALTGMATFGSHNRGGALVVGYATPAGHSFTGALERLRHALNAS